MKIRDMIHLEFTSKLTDIMSNRYDFGMQYEVVINNTQTSITKQQLGEDALLWFIDGSKMDAGIGIGVTGARFKLSKSSGNTLAIYQTEMSYLCPKISRRGALGEQESISYQIARKHYRG